MVFSESGSLSGAESLTGQASADTLVTVSPTFYETAWEGRRPGSVEGRVGSVRWYLDVAGRPAVEIQALEGEVFRISV
jgi:hypothetical protein